MFTEKEVADLIQEAIDTAFDNFKKQKNEMAEMILVQTLKIVPTNKNALRLMGLIKHHTQKYQEAIEYCKQALEQDETDCETLNNMALALSGLEEYSKAAECLEKAIKINPEIPYLYSNLAIQYRLLNKRQQAILAFETAIKIKPHEMYWTMLGGCYAEVKQFTKAEICFKNALQLNPEFDGAHVDLATVYQFTNRTQQAWKHYEYRKNIFEQLKIFKEVFEPEKAWDGKIQKDLRLLIHAEQGLGDTIHFVRYLPLLKEKGIHTILHCDKSFEGLFTELSDEFYYTDPTKMPKYAERNDFSIPQYDFHCSLLSLPHLLKCPPVPEAPYVHVKENINLEVYPEFKIGISWAGNPMHPNDKYRSCYLKEFKPIHDIPNVKLFSLVKDLRCRKYKSQKEVIDLTEDTDDMRIVDMSSQIDNFYSTAKIINSLDMIVSVDTSVLHLAGAMNKDCAALLCYDCDWRWGSQGKYSYWYPSITLFRQKKKNDWEHVISDIVDYIKEKKQQF